MVTASISTASILREVAKVGRKLRTPTYDFRLNYKPWAIQPFVCAPVLPGETMKNALVQARVVTDPIKNSLLGWHSEMYLFYVKLRDLDARDEIVAMLMTPGYDTSTLTYQWDHPTSNLAGFDTLTGHMQGINWPRMCLDRVVDEYFRDEGDNPAFLDRRAFVNEMGTPGLPPASFQTRKSWHDSIKLHSLTPADDHDQLLGQEPEELHIPAGFEAAYAQFRQMQDLKLTTATFEDWLRQFGVKAPKADREDSHKPELLRYIRDWKMPSNTVDPATGIPSSAVVWDVAERADKDRFFNEPGFVFGVVLARPKVYLGKTFSQASTMLNDAFAWLPAIMAGDPYTSLKKFSAQSGPLGHPFGPGDSPSEAYWADVRDLFLYGDQMLHTPGYSYDGVNVVMAPRANLERRYATDAEADALFKTADKNKVRCDGVISLSILGTQEDHTP